MPPADPLRGGVCDQRTGSARDGRVRWLQTLCACHRRQHRHRCRSRHSPAIQRGRERHLAHTPRHTVCAAESDGQRSCQMIVAEEQGGRDRACCAVAMNSSAMLYAALEYAFGRNELAREHESPARRPRCQEAQRSIRCSAIWTRERGHRPPNSSQQPTACRSLARGFRPSCFVGSGVSLAGTWRHAAG